MYRRDTELRHMRANDVYKLGVILDDNNCWKKLMEIIPKEMNAQASSADGALDWERAAVSGFKYNTDHIRLIENAIKRPGESRLFSQILFDEWGTSGRKCERPTLGVLLQLLVKAELFRAADYVAMNYLDEPPPERPLNGPAARIDITLSSEIFNDIKDLVNDSAVYPSTAALNDNANHGYSLADKKEEFYTKYECMDKQVLTNDGGTPIPPPRTLRSARLLLQQQQQQQQQLHRTNTNEATTAEAVSSGTDSLSGQPELSSSDLPKLSQLIANNDHIANSGTHRTSNEHLHSEPGTESTYLSDAPIPLISVLGGSRATVQTETTNLRSDYTSNASEMLPVISALNLNGERDNVLMEQELVDVLPPSQSVNTQQHSNNLAAYTLPDVLENIMENDGNEEQLNEEDENNGEDDENEDEDDDSSVPNLSIFEQRSSNNDSSLTNVTGTSGENSFELSINDCSSTSTENIPCLSALKP